MPEPATPATCLSGLVGLSAAGSACFPLPTEPGGSDYITATSQGVFVDDVEGLPLKPAQGQAVGSDLYSLLDRARRQAEQVVAASLAAPLSAALGAPRFGSSGLLGGAGAGRPAVGPARLDFTTGYAPGLGLELRAVLLHATAATPEPVALLLDGQPVGLVTANAGLFVPLLTPAGGPVVVPFDGAAHALRAVLPEGVAPILSMLTCNCGGDPWVTTLRGQLAPGFNLKAETAGLQVQARIVCMTEGGPLCAALAQDAEATRFAALAVLYKSAEHLLVHFLSNAGHNRYTTLEPQAMVPLAKRYAEKAAEYLDWLNGPDGLRRLPNDCYACKPGPLHLTLVR